MMLKSQLFVGNNKKRVLETIRIAAYFPKRLNKKLIQMTNIPSSVDAILQDQVVTCGVLGFLLWGIVRIYSKKVQYVREDCDRLLVKLNEFAIKKKTNTTIDEAICEPFPSITRPNSFQLDAFNLEISEVRVCSHVRPNEDLMLEDVRKDAEFSYHSLDKKYSPTDGLNSGVFSAALTPFSDFLASHFKENEIMSSSTCTIFGSEPSIEKLRDNSFFLAEMLDPMILGEVDREHTRVPNVEAYVRADEGPSSARAYNSDQEIINVEKSVLSPESMSGHQVSINIDVTPKLKDPSASFVREYAEEYTGVNEGPSSVSVGAFADDQDMDTVEKVTAAKMIDRQDSILVDVTPKLKDQNASSVGKFAEDYIGVKEGPSSVRAYDVDQEMEIVEKIVTSVMITPECTKDQRAPGDATPVFKDTGEKINYENEEMEIVDKIVTSVMVTPECTKDQRASGDATPVFKDTGEKINYEDQEMEIVDKIVTSVMITPECTKDQRASGDATPVFKDTGEKINFPTMEASVLVDATPIFKGTNASVMSNLGLPKLSLPVKRTAAGEHIINSSLGEQLMTPNKNIAQNAPLTNKPAIEEQASKSASNKKMVRSASVSGTPTRDFMAIQTPAAKEHGRFSRKRKCLVDDTRVLPTSVLKENIANPCDLVRARMRLPHACLHVWKIQKISNLPHSLFEPLIPYSSLLGSVFSLENIKKVKVAEATEIPQMLNILEPPIIHQSPDREVNLTGPSTVPQSPEQEVILLEPPIIPPSPEQEVLIPQSPEQEVNIVEPPYNHQSPDIAPSTPITFSSSAKLHDGPFDSLEEEFIEFDNEDINLSKLHIVPPDSLEQDCNENIEFDNEDINSSKFQDGPSGILEEYSENIEFNNEDMNSSAEDSWEMSKWSVRTRAAARCLCNKFLSQRRRKEDEVVNLCKF